MKKHLLHSLIFCAFIASSQTIKYVNPNATGNGSGTSWANAYTSLKAALLNAKHNDEFWLTYNANYTIDPLQNNVYITIDKDISLYGGFKGTETSRSQRTALPSIISGSIAMAGAEDNSQKAFEIKSKVHFEGIRFTDFYSMETSYQDKVGIVKVADKAVVSFKNCDFRNNESVRCIDILNNAKVNIEQGTFYTNNRQKSAPVIKILNSDLSINNSDFQFNGDGSFIIDAYTNQDTIYSGGTISILNTEFLENKAGVVYNTIAEVDIRNCIIKNDDFYNHTVYHYPKVKTLRIDKTDFSGYLSGLIVNFGQIDSLILTNNKFDLALSNNAHAIYGGAKNVRIKNCDFGTFDASVDPIYIYGADSSVELSKLHFRDVTRSDNLFYISGKKIMKIDSCIFENVVMENNHLFYLYTDTMLVSNTKFIGLKGEMFYGFNPYKKFSNCIFGNIKITSNPLFYQSNGGYVTEVENCLFDNCSIGYSTFILHGYPFIYNGSGDLILKNNMFKSIKTNDYFLEIGSYGKVKCYGNLFERIEANKGILNNEAGDLTVFNSNFTSIDKPIFVNDDTYSSNPENSRLYVLNSVLYSTNDTLYREVHTNTIPTTFENNYTNKSLGTNNYNNSLISYHDLYTIQNIAALFDKGIKEDSTLAGITEDVLGNKRKLFDKIDIGCLEYWENPLVSSLDHQIAMSSGTMVYPNPAQDRIVVTLPHKSKVKVTNLYGQSFFEGELNEGVNELNVSGLEAGMYMLTTTGNSKASSIKFTIK